MPNTIAYLLLFLPLIASVFCFLVNSKKSDFLIFVSTLIALLIFITKLSLDFSVSGEIVNDAGLGALSIPTEYFLDFLSLFFLFAVVIAKILMVFFYRSDLFQVLNNDNRQLFYATWLLNIFGMIGIFSTNNIFNLFVFIEIYCLTFCAIMTMSDDLNLSKLAFKYFCNSVLGSVLLLLAFVWLYTVFGSLQIDKIDSSLISKTDTSKYWAMSFLIGVAIWLKFFPINLYFCILKSRDSIANLLLNSTFVINGLIGFYLLLRILVNMVDYDDFALDLSAMAGVVLVLYSNYKMLKVRYFKVFAAYFLLVNLGFVLITFFIEDSLLASLLYISNYALTGLVIFFLSGYFQKNYQTCHFKFFQNISSKSNGWRRNIVILILIFIVLNLPLSLLFWANWNLALMAFGLNDGVWIILPIMTTNLSLAYLSTSLLCASGRDMSNLSKI